MGTASNPFVTLMTLLFGALIGVVLAVGLAYFLGFISWDQRGGNRAVIVSETPGMDMLNAFQCRKSETKHIILGGAEDNFNLDTVEEIPLNEVHREIFRRGNYKNRIGKRDYDEGGTDKFAIDQFTLPTKTVNGLFVTRIKPLSELKNDTLTIGDLRDFRKRSDNLAVTWYDNERPAEWRYENGVFSTNIENIKFTDTRLPRDYNSLLDYVRDEGSPSPVYVLISDDTVVDFMGFAVCAEPASDLGMTYVSGTRDMPTGVVEFSCRNEDEVICDAYEGDYSCSNALPLVCFNDTKHEKPLLEEGQFPLITSDTLNQFWSGGEILLSTPVHGNQFENEDQVNAFCAKLFGAEWRAASHHESYSDNLIGYGDAPKGTRAWVNVKDSPHGNCWKRRPEFEAANE